MPEPGDQKSAAARSRGLLRASRADREQVIEALKDAFVQDRLDKDEFDARVGQVLASRTYAELAAVTADLPAAPVPAAPVAATPPAAASARRRARSPQDKGYKAAVGVFAALWACLLAGVEIVAPDGNPVRALVAWAVFTTFCALVFGALLLLHARLDQHAAGPLPPGQGPGAMDLEGQRPSQLGPAGAPRRTPGRLPSSRRGAQTPFGVRPVPGAM